MNPEIGKIRPASGRAEKRKKSTKPGAQSTKGELRIGELTAANEQLAAEIKERKAIEERYRHLVTHAPAGIYEVDFSNGRFTEVNDVMCRLLGYTREELLAMSAPQILDDEGKARFASRVRRAQAGDKPDEAVEYRVRKKDGTFIWGLLNTTFRWDGGKIVGAMVVASDITDRKIAEEKTKQVSEELRRSNEELVSFNNAMIGRELRMIELKKEINRLCRQLGQPLRYGEDPESSEQSAP